MHIHTQPTRSGVRFSGLNSLSYSTYIQLIDTAQVYLKLTETIKDINGQAR